LPVPDLLCGDRANHFRMHGLSSRRAIVQSPAHSGSP